MAENIQVSISNDSVQTIIKAHVQTAVLDALRPHSEQFVRELVEKSLLAKSTDDRYRYNREEQKPTWLEHTVRAVIAEEATKAIKDWAESHREQIAEQIKKSIASQGFAKKWALQIVEGMLAATVYRWTVNVEPVISEKNEL